MECKLRCVTFKIERHDREQISSNEPYSCGRRNATSHWTKSCWKDRWLKTHPRIPKMIQKLNSEADDADTENEDESSDIEQTNKSVPFFSLFN